MRQAAGSTPAHRLLVTADRWERLRAMPDHPVLAYGRAVLMLGGGRRQAELPVTVRDGALVLTLDIRGDEGARLMYEAEAAGR